MKTILLTSLALILSINLYAQTSGGPDAFGYVWRDSNDPNGPAFNWIDITSMPGAVQITGLTDDNTVGPFPIGFSFDYYTGSSSQFWVGSNGNIRLSSPALVLASPFPTIPSASQPNNFIAPFTADLFFDTLGTGEAWYYTSPGNDTLIVSWINAPFWDANPPGYQGLNTFQVILIEQNRNIIFQYQQQTGVSSAVTNFITVGMENSTGTIGLNPYFDTYPPANYTMEFYSQPINRIKGYCFIDNNLNGIKDGNESGINQLMVNSTGGYTYTSQPDVNGYFSNPADTGSTTTIIQNLLYYTVTPASHISTFATYYNTDTINFAMVPVPGIQDVSVSIIPLTPARPGFNVTYQISYTNLGTVTMSDSLYFISDTLLNYVSSTQPVINFNGDTMTFSYQNLAPLQTQTIEVTFSIPVPPTVQIGTIFTLSAYIKPYATDMNAENNSMQIHQTVTGSYDPNDKTMLGGSFITPTQVADGDYMHYLIRFQNSGNDTAFTVIVRDTLSSNLQWSTFEMVNASHPYTLTIQDNNILKWDFDHINLPDSNVNEPASHGYIVYKIKPLSSLALGASILNTANIYFDFNLPIKTNTESTIVSPVGIKENPGSLSGIKIFPNPNNGEFIIDLGAQYEKLEIKISNTLWQVLDQQTLTNQRFVNASISEKSGMYFIQINTDKGSKVLKIIKQ